MAGIFKVGDRVYLRKPHSNNAVGHGTVVLVHLTFRVHTIPLGNDSIVVRVDHVDDYLHPLPLQLMDATHLGEIELGMNVRWPTDLLRQFSLPDDPVQDDALRDGARVQCSQSPFLAQLPQIDYTNRQNWFLLEVYIVMKITDGAKIPVAEGLVTQTAPSTSINNKELGELNHEVQNDQESEVPVSSGDEDDDEEFIGETLPPPESRKSQPEFEPAKKKRHYNSSVRNPPDPLRRARSNAKKKVQQETIEEKIRGIQRTTCCGDLCCRKVSYEVIRQCRLEYFGLPHDDKEEYIHTRLHMRHQSVIDEGKHIIDQKLICKRGFWTIYGFSKTKYYKMIA
ncbi:hypothetical protein R1sor_004896 [Riccia sorocarpa]|uniref:Uncharacterized protein n=1 Tax=Riccia sorocarpa TaxID=122646 RepID=A0ABD3HHY8_9MARC